MDEKLGATQTSGLVPVRIVEDSASIPCKPQQFATPATPAGIEITLPDGYRVRVGNDVSLLAIRRIMTALRG